MAPAPSAAGGVELPAPVRALMRRTARVMTRDRLLDLTFECANVTLCTLAVSSLCIKSVAARLIKRHSGEPVWKRTSSR